MRSTTMYLRLQKQLSILLNLKRILQTSKAWIIALKVDKKLRPFLLKERKWWRGRYVFFSVGMNNISIIFKICKV